MARIDDFAEFVLSWEGGFVNHPNDTGGATNMGVTIGTWRNVGYDKDGDGDIDIKDLKLLTKEDVIDNVMRPYYWDKCLADYIKSKSVACIIVDWYWGSGRAGIKKVQRLLGVPADGIIGNQTLAAINRQDPRTFFAAIKRERIAFFKNIVKKNPSQKVFLKGWLRRLSYINFGSLQLNSLKYKIIRWDE